MTKYRAMAQSAALAGVASRLARMPMMALVRGWGATVSRAAHAGVLAAACGELEEIEHLVFTKPSWRELPVYCCPDCKQTIAVR